MSSSSLIYQLPEYYDIAFERDLGPEVEFYGRCFERFGSGPVAHLLEPACGSGMFLEAFPKRGYQVTGYDLSPESVAYARTRIANAGLSEKVQVLEGDMREITFKPPLDAAYNSNNTLSYCLTDLDILRHFRATSASLKTGAVYVVEVSCAYETPESENDVGDTWSMERDGIQITGTWRVVAYDRERKVRHIDSRFYGDRRGEPFAFEEKHQLRLWEAGDMLRLAVAGGFEVAAAYDLEFRRLDNIPEIRGEVGNVFFVLVNRGQR